MTLQEIIDQCEVQGAVRVMVGERTVYESLVGFKDLHDGRTLNKDVQYIYPSPGNAKTPSFVVFEVE